MAIAVFVYADWAALYPGLAAKVAEPAATLYFAQAGLYLDNTDASPVCDVTQRLMLLYMLTAHIAALAIAVASGNTLVGRVTSGTEGSVTIAADYGVPGKAAWYAQSTYGAAYWQAILPLRSFQYRPGRQPYLGVPYGGLGGFGWGR